MKFRTTEIKYFCPHCGGILKRQVSDESLNFLCIVLFIPIGLIVLIAKLIDKATKPKKMFTVLGEEIVQCPSCGQFIAMSSYPNLPHSRVLPSEETEALGVNKNKESITIKNCSNCKHNINETSCDVWRKKPIGNCDEYSAKNHFSTKKDFINS